MTTARESAAAALVDLSKSPSWRDRIDAAIALTTLLDVSGVPARIQELVLDPEDTAVTRWTIDALMRRGDGLALAVVAGVLPLADNQTLDWITTGIGDALDWADERATRAATCQTLPRSAGTEILTGLLAAQ